MSLAERQVQMTRNRGARKASNAVAGILIGLGTLVVLVPLFWIFGYLIVNGLSAIDFNFFSFGSHAEY